MNPPTPVIKRKETVKTFRKIFYNEGSTKTQDPISTYALKDYKKHHEQNVMNAAKYTLLTFLPVALFRELTRPVNLYFGVMTILWLIPYISPFRMETVLGPYIFIIVVALIREAAEDVGRHISDRYTVL